MELNPLLDFEKRLWTEGCIRVAGMDEAGRGPLAGPVVAAAVVFDRRFIEVEYSGVFRGLDDSKKLSERQRNVFYALLTDSPLVEIGVGQADVSEIDSLNILRATHLAMSRALKNLPSMPDYVIVDGRPVPGLPVPSTAIVKGDSKSCSIAAASVVAKVVRDKLMVAFDKKFPEYGFKKHKGYGTSMHLQALLKHGPTPQHRRSFTPVRNIAGILGRIGDSRSCSVD